MSASHEDHQQEIEEEGEREGERRRAREERDRERRRREKEEERERREQEQGSGMERQVMDSGESLYVGNLDPSWTSEDVIDMLRPAGQPIANIGLFILFSS